MGFFDRLRRAAERVTSAVADVAEVALDAAADVAEAALDAAANALDVAGGVVAEPESTRPSQPTPRRQPARPASVQSRNQKDATPGVAPEPKPKPKPKPKTKRKGKRKAKPYQRVPAGEVYYYKGKRYVGGRFAPMRAKPRRAPAPGSRVPAGQTLRLPSGKVLKGGQFIPKSARGRAALLQDAIAFPVGRRLFGGAWEVTTPKLATHWVGLISWIDPETDRPAYMQTRIGLSKENVAAEAKAMANMRTENGASKQVNGAASVSIVPIRRVREVAKTKVPG